MPGPVVDFDKYLKLVPTHSEPLPQESEVPSSHYRRSANDAWNLFIYVERNLAHVNVYGASYERHIRRLGSMVMLTIIEAFERFLKEVAAVCINHVGQRVLDDRLDVFSAKGSVVAAHFTATHLGQALCESLTWCDCDDTNKRLRRILANPFESGSFYVFPNSTQQPESLRNRRELMNLVWQLRHTIAHNVGVITPSDAVTYRLLTQREVESPRLLWPAKGDIWYVKLFIDETVELVNREVAARLGELLTTIHEQDPSIFAAGDEAQALSSSFGVQVTVAGQSRNAQ